MAETVLEKAKGGLSHFFGKASAHQEHKAEHHEAMAELNTNMAEEHKAAHEKMKKADMGDDSALHEEIGKIHKMHADHFKKVAALHTKTAKAHKAMVTCCDKAATNLNEEEAQPAKAATGDLAKTEAEKAAEVVAQKAAADAAVVKAAADAKVAGDEAAAVAKAAKDKADAETLAKGSTGDLAVALTALTKSLEPLATLDEKIKAAVKDALGDQVVRGAAKGAGFELVARNGVPIEKAANSDMKYGSTATGGV
jgi:colicin import membrane protein